MIIDCITASGRSDSSSPHGGCNTTAKESSYMHVGLWMKPKASNSPPAAILPLKSSFTTCHFFHLSFYFVIEARLRRRSSSSKHICSSRTV